ncbi:MAG: murI [Fibrobacteria bacterium]|nr:murI [Fibrobacteria bacterium]
MRFIFPHMPLGFFDSGFGGLTVYRKAREILPQYDMLYLGDTARTPYGNRSFEAILRFTTEGVEYLFAQGCDLVVIACNTASAKALRTIQQKILPVKYPGKRVLGIIRPSAESLALRAEALSRRPHSGSAAVALWATEGTVRSDSYALELAKLAPDLRLVQIACPLLVPLVESGELSGPGLQYFLEKYWRATVEAAGLAKIDTLLLACTHYPLLYPPLRSLVPAGTDILVQADIVAPALADYLARHPEIEGRLARGAHGTGSERFLTTDQTENFARLASLFLGRDVAAERVEIGS